MDDQCCMNSCILYHVLYLCMYRYIIIFNNKIQQQITDTNKQIKMQETIDYRNARYQGNTDYNQLRHGPGLLIDDDLSFYSSQWQQGKLNNSTVIYISHGKYIYGQWKDNQPHGLNVFRIGDTVVLGEFQCGRLCKKILVIFQKLNFVAVIQDNCGDWDVIDRGMLKNYNQLVRYIQQAEIPMKPQFFSLTKFLTSISNQSVAAVPCPGSQNCYYGFEQGLGIIFNPNNGVVSVGCHDNKKLTQYGGKYDIPRQVTQGNFQTNEIIRYSFMSAQRPKHQIYQIYQKLHKRSLDFKNEYFDSKVKLLTSIEELVRGKIDDIMDGNYNKKNSKNVNQQNTFTALDLNDSLDYHAENQEDVYKMREQVYEAVHIPMKKATSQYVEASPKKSAKKYTPTTPNKKKPQPIIDAPVSPMLAKKSTVKSKDIKIEDERQMMRTPSKKSTLHKIQYEVQQFRQQTFAKMEDPYVQKQIQSYQNQQSSSSKSPMLVSKSSSSSVSSAMQRPLCQQQPPAVLNQTRNRSPYLQPKYSNSDLNDIRNSNENQIVNSAYQDALVSSKKYIRQKQQYNVPSFKYSYSQVQKISQNSANNNNNNKLSGSQKLIRVQNNRQYKIENAEWIQSSNAASRSSTSPLNSAYRRVDDNSASKSPSKAPGYQNLSDRRKRLLKQFKNLNTSEKGQSSSSSRLGRLQQPHALTLISTIVNSISSSPVLNRNQAGTASSKLLKPSSSYNQSVTQNYQPPVMQSPYARQRLPSFDFQSKKMDQSQGEAMMPLTICKGQTQHTDISYAHLNNNNNNNNSYTGLRQQQSSEFNYEKQDKTNKIVDSKVDRIRERIDMYAASNSNNNSNWAASKTNINDRAHKENYDIRPIANRPFQKKQSHYQRVPQVQLQKQKQREQLTPTRRKVYKYYFDQV